MAFNGPEPEPDAVTLARRTGEWHGLTLPPAGADTAPAAPLAVDSVPGYELLGEVGRGGMGVVYRARHIRLNRIVALKMVLAGAHARGADLQRFRAEAEAIARLQHPNVVQVYDVGEANGLPYLSLELCAGSLADRLDGTPWPPGPAAELVETLAGAVHAAHNAGVLHRDIKPANVLMSGVRSQESGVNEGDTLLTPDSCLLTPKLTDFGLAKRIDGSGAGPTATGAILGTPEYMAPEQAGGGAAAVGPAADTYALGAILYELLTGRPPFRAATPFDTILQVVSNEPLAPTKLNPTMPRDLETITLKCLTKDPAKRYASAASLAADLRRYLVGEPIQARPVGRIERVRKWCRRRPTAAALIVVSVLAVLATIVGGIAYTSDVNAARNLAIAEKIKANDRERDAVQNLYVARSALAQAAWRENELGRMRGLLDAMRPQPEHEDQRGFEWYHLWELAHGYRLSLPGYDGQFITAVSPDGRLVVLSDVLKSHVRFREVATGAERHVVSPLNATALAFSPDGRRLAASGISKDAAGRSLRMLCVVDTGAGSIVWSQTSPYASPAYTGMAFSPDGRRVIARGRIFDAVTGTEDGGLRLDPNEKPVRATFSPDGKHVAVTMVSRANALEVAYTTRVFDVASGAATGALSTGTMPEKLEPAAMAYSPDGKRLALAASTQVIIWEVNAKTEPARLRGSGARITSVAFSHDGTLIAAGAEDRTVQVWDAASGAPGPLLKGPTHPCRALRFGPENHALIGVSGIGEVTVWDPTRPQGRRPIPPPAAVRTDTHITGLAFSPDGTRYATNELGDLRTISVIDAATGTVAVSMNCGSNRYTPFTFSSDGRYIAGTKRHTEIAVWDVATGKEVCARSVQSNTSLSVAFSADGRRLAGGDPHGPVRVWEFNSGEAPALVEISRMDGLGTFAAMAFSPDGRRVAVETWEGLAATSIIVLDADTGREVFRRRLPKLVGPLIVFSPDSRWIVSHGAAADVQFWDAETGTPGLTLTGFGGLVHRLAFSPDGRRIATQNSDAIKLWDSRSGQEVLSFPAGGMGCTAFVFLANGTQLAAGFVNGTVTIWDAPLVP